MLTRNPSSQIPIGLVNESVIWMKTLIGIPLKFFEQSIQYLADPVVLFLVLLRNRGELLP